jgi:pentatricopeptide repeat protein
MRQEGIESDDFTAICMLNVCGKLSNYSLGREIYARHNTSASIVVHDAALKIFVTCECATDAVSVFATIKQMRQATAERYVKVITVCAKANMETQAQKFFTEMMSAGLKLDDYNITSLLTVCGNARNLALGSLVHEYIQHNRIQISDSATSALINMFSKCGKLEEASTLFMQHQQTKKLNVITWTGMMNAFIQVGREHQALNLFKQMEKEGVEPDDVAFSLALQACKNARDLTYGKELHAKIISTQKLSSVTETALLSMYARCGTLDDAVNIFNEWTQFNSNSKVWTTMINLVL